MGKSVKVSLVIVDITGKPVDVIDSFEATVRTDEHGTPSPIGLAQIQDMGYEKIEEMVKIELEIVE